ncbi:cell division protein FtsW (lipid II flippase) [Clostridium pascui]|uniref:cell division protein n=1 Tax=Clostridium pascui TaxID=46609 RepID=UPI0019579B10|nr:cell division protein [Clostridium pascui]MBM7868608.1 cell division protein FtsW (lipid II flippase) [Clostridium pascui]
MVKSRITNFIPLIFTIPSISIGVITMYYNKVPAFIWAQNIACLVIIGMISYFLVSNKFNIRGSKFYYGSILISLIFIILTLIMSGIAGVHRWVSIGIIKFNASMIVLPIIIIASWKLLHVKSLWITTVTTITISVLLTIQPDASQLTGFAIPMMVMLVSRTDKKSLRLIMVVVLSTLIIISWVFLDSLPAVAYVEGILGLLKNVGLVWFILGLISLIMLPVPFIFFSPKNLKLPSICLGLYFMIILISTLFGNFPVPLMGYGISPIIGYFISISWYTRAKITEQYSYEVS